MVLQADTAELLIWLASYTHRKSQFESEFAQFISTQLGLVHANDVYVVSLVPGEAPDTSFVNFTAGVPFSFVNATMDAAERSYAFNDSSVGAYTAMSMSRLVLIELSHQYSEHPWLPNDIEIPCENNPADWHPDGLLFGCEYYRAEKFCRLRTVASVINGVGQLTTVAEVGPGWVVDQFGALSDFRDASGRSGIDACCVCGGGWSGQPAPEPAPIPEPEPVQCIDDPDGVLSTIGSNCTLAAAALGGNCTGAELQGFTANEICPHACNFGCGYVPSAADLQAQANLLLAGRRLQQNTLDRPDPSRVAKKSRPQQFGWFFNVLEEVDTKSELGNSELDRRERMLGGADFINHSVQLVHLPAHPEKYIGSSANTTLPSPIVLNLTCSRTDSQPTYSPSLSNVTIRYQFANGTITIRTPARIISWAMRGACPALFLHVAKDTSTRTSLLGILDALRVYSLNAMLCALVFAGWLVVCVLRRGFLTSPPASELHPFRLRELVPDVLSREDLVVTWEREGPVFKTLLCLDVLALILFCARDFMGLVSLAQEVHGASEVCSTDGDNGDHPAGNMWLSSAWLCGVSFAVQLIGVCAVPLYGRCRHQRVMEEAI